MIEKSIRITIGFMFTKTLNYNVYIVSSLIICIYHMYIKYKIKTI